MASFTAELHVDGHIFPVRHCAFEVEQPVAQRGRVSAKVRYSPVQVVLDVPAGDTLLAWAAAPHSHQAAAIVFLDANGGSALESLRLPEAYCVAYEEQFYHGDATTGAYRCLLTLSTHTGWTIVAGGPASNLQHPAAGEYEAAAAAGAGISSLQALAIGGSPAAPRTLVDPADIPPHLPAPQPNPSPDHAQVYLTATEWQAIIQGRWDNSKSAENKKFTLLKPHRQTEFHVEGDPFTYRVDDRGRMTAVYDAATQKSYNVTGTRKGLTYIALTLSEEPTYAGTPHMFPVTGSQKNVVQIEMVGNRKGDFKAANEAAGLLNLIKAEGGNATEAPEGYTWHHRADFVALPPPNPPYGTCTMELVEERAHQATFVHKGSCDQCNKHFPQPGQRKLYQ